MHNEYIDKKGKEYTSRYPENYDLDSDDVRRNKYYEECVRAPQPLMRGKKEPESKPVALEIKQPTINMPYLGQIEEENKKQEKKERDATCPRDEND